MVQGLIKISLKSVAYLVIWTFLLSLRWEGRTLFDRSHELLVDNEMVAFLDAELVEVWQKLYDSATLAFGSAPIQEEKIQ